MIFLDIAGWILFSVILMGFIEHQVHAQLMHKRNFLSERNEGFKRTFEAHAIFHHGHYAKSFTDEPVPPGEDQEIRLTVRKAPRKALPFALVIAIFSWQCALIFIATVVFHHWVWNQIHLEMHKPSGKHFSNWPIYLFVCRYHYLHHVYPNKNFNVVFPIFDLVLGTLAKPTEKDISNMISLGFYGEKKRQEQARLQNEKTKVLVAAGKDR